jgi:amino acid permease
VNIPLSYLVASLAMRFLRADFAVLVTVAYWLTNIAGLFLMYVSGRKIFAEKKIVPEAIKLVLTVVLYSAILILAARTGFLKPLKV